MRENERICDYEAVLLYSRAHEVPEAIGLKDARTLINSNRSVVRSAGTKTVVQQGRSSFEPSRMSITNTHTGGRENDTLEKSVEERTIQQTEWSFGPNRTTLKEVESLFSYADTNLQRVAKKELTEAIATEPAELSVLIDCIDSMPEDETYEAVRTLDSIDVSGFQDAIASLLMNFLSEGNIDGAVEAVEALTSVYYDISGLQDAIVSLSKDPNYDVDFSIEEINKIIEYIYSTSPTTQTIWNADLQNIVLTDNDLSGIDLRKANLNGAVLRRADLSNALLSNADLRNADLRGANLNNAVFLKANLKKANLAHTKLIDTNFYGADLTETNFCGADLSNAHFTASNLEKSECPQSDAE